MIITAATSTTDFMRMALSYRWTIAILASSATASGTEPPASCKSVLYEWRDANRSTNRVCAVRSNTIAVSFVDPRHISHGISPVAR